MEIVVLLFMFGAVMALTIGVSHVSVNRTNRACQDLARRYGLEFTPATWNKQPRMRGIVQGIEVEIFTIVRGSGKSQTVYLIHQAALPVGCAPPGLVMFHEGILSKIGKVIGKEDIQTGVADIDKAFIVRGASEKEVNDFLSRPGVREALMNFVQSDKSMRLDGGKLVIETIGGMGRSKLVEDRLLLITRYAVALGASYQAEAPASSSTKKWDDDSYGDEVVEATGNPVNTNMWW